VPHTRRPGTGGLYLWVLADESRQLERLAGEVLPRIGRASAC